ncbi:class I SAM-dependent methyltransferase [Ignavibacterium sp.]|uniref:class I SAM-dependent methyltransferase n=1 Tax=Ignavibacterium sp. TaxID=2651167 RepID=UPI00307E6078
MNNNFYKCILCNNAVSEAVKSNNYTYYICSFCKTSQILPQPSKVDLNKYYNMFHLSSDKGGNYDWVEQRMISDFSSKVLIIKSFLSKSNQKLLDVGCGKGFFVKEALSNKFIAEGIDISSSGINYAKEVLKIIAQNISIEEFSKVESNKNKFDVVTLWATIEHIPDGLGLLKSIKKCLKPGGLLFLDTGLGNVKEEKYLSGHSQWFDALQHLFVYSENGLKLLLENAGFEILLVDRNFERSFFRRMIKNFRHKYLCYASYIFLKPILGTSGFKSMKEEAKWPIGKLIQIIAVIK